MEDLHKLLPRTEDAYLTNRVSEQITWYDNKSAVNKKIFLSLKISEIMLALMIPFLSGYVNLNDVAVKMTIGILGILVAGIAGLITLIKFQENWIEYRTVAESLKLEKYLFLSKAGPYQQAQDAFPLFVERIESLLSNSTKKWTSYVTKIESKQNLREKPVLQSSGE
jgi:hypothetical protein